MSCGKFNLLVQFVCVAVAVAPASWGNQETRIGSVPPQYTPTAGTEEPEPVSVQNYSFEVQPDTGRARVVVEYTYPDQAALGREGGIGPLPTKAQLPGLRYDRESKD